MPSSFLLARNHLEQAIGMLQGGDSQSRQLRYIIERTITLMDDLRPAQPRQRTNVLDFETFRARRPQE
jgi:hypothetical protein